MKFIYATLLMLASTLAAAQEYKVKVKGISAGTAKLSISESGDDYTVQLMVHPNMVAKMFDVTDMRETATGKIVDGKVVPQKYKREELNGKQLLSVIFAKNSVRVNKQGEKKSFAIQRFAQDPLSQILQVQKDLQAGTVGWGYYTVTDRREYYSQVKQEGNKISLIHEKYPDDVVTVWFDDNYQLQRMRKIDGGSVVFDMKKK